MLTLRQVIRVVHDEIAQRRVYWWSYMTSRTGSEKTRTEPVAESKTTSLDFPAPRRAAGTAADMVTDIVRRKGRVRAQRSVEDTETAEWSSAWASRTPG